MTVRLSEERADYKSLIRKTQNLNKDKGNNYGKN